MSLHQEGAADDVGNLATTSLDIDDPAANLSFESTHDLSFDPFLMELSDSEDEDETNQHPCESATVVPTSPLAPSFSSILPNEGLESPIVTDITSPLLPDVVFHSNETRMDTSGRSPTTPRVGPQVPLFQHSSAHAVNNEESLTGQHPSQQPQNMHTWKGFKIVVDNIDKTVKP